MDMLSDGELYRMQQEAIERARATARRSPAYSGVPLITAPQKNKPEKEKQTGFSKITEIFNLKDSDSLILIGVIALLLADGCEDKLLLLALIFLLLKD